MFLLCALSLAGEWRSANIDVAVESNTITPYSFTIPVPPRSGFLRPIVVEMNVDSDSATYTYTAETAENVVKSIVTRFGSHIEESQIREIVDFEPPEPTIIGRSNLTVVNTDKQRFAMKGLAKLEHKALGGGRSQVTISSTMCTAVLHVDLLCRVVDQATGRIVVKEVSRPLMSSEARVVFDAMDREIEKHVGVAPEKTIK